MFSTISPQIENIQSLAYQDAKAIENWYLVRRNQVLMELDRLETIYKERMEEHYAEWSQKLYTLYAEEHMSIENDETTIRAVPPIPKLTRKTNMRLCGNYMVEYDNVNGSLDENIIARFFYKNGGDGGDGGGTRHMCVGTDDA